MIFTAFSIKNFKASDKKYIMSHSINKRQQKEKIPFPLFHWHKIWKDEKGSDSNPGFSSVKKNHVNLTEGTQLQLCA